MSEQHLLDRHYGGWSPSLPDQRDHHADLSGIKLLLEVDPRAEMPPVYDQGRLGSCTANAVAAAVEYAAVIENRDIGGTPSRLEIYYAERLIEHLPVSEDTGAWGRDGFRHAYGQGTIPESDWPYDVAKFAERPPLDQEDRHRCGAYKAVPKNLHAMKAALSNHQTVAFGFTVYESFESAAVDLTGVVPMPEPDERVLGGHEVLLVGYLKSEPNHGLVRNSWGASWGVGGYCLFPWAYLLSSNADDHRTIYRPAA
jgi:C1A family cysteine protease